LTRAYGWTRNYILFDLPGRQGWAFYAWAIENNPDYRIERTTPGYIAQHVERMMKSPPQTKTKKKRR